MAAAESIKALDYRIFEKLLKSKYKSADVRRRIIRKLLTELVEKERVKTTLPRAKDLARVANRMIDLAKEDNEPVVNTWLLKKSLVPKVFDVLKPRYETMTEYYTKVYRIPPREGNKSQMGIVDFLGNNLPQFEPSEEELVKLRTDFLIEKLKLEIPPEGILV